MNLTFAASAARHVRGRTSGQHTHDGDAREKGGVQHPVASPAWHTDEDMDGAPSGALLPKTDVRMRHAHRKPVCMFKPQLSQPLVRVARIVALCTQGNDACNPHMSSATKQGRWVVAIFDSRCEVVRVQMQVEESRPPRCWRAR